MDANAIQPNPFTCADCRHRKPYQVCGPRKAIGAFLAQDYPKGEGAPFDADALAVICQAGPNFNVEAFQVDITPPDPNEIVTEAPKRVKDMGTGEYRDVPRCPLDGDGSSPEALQ